METTKFQKKKLNDTKIKKKIKCAHHLQRKTSTSERKAYNKRNPSEEEQRETETPIKEGQRMVFLFHKRIEFEAKKKKLKKKERKS